MARTRSVPDRSAPDNAEDDAPAATAAERRLLRQQLRDMADQLRIITERLYSLTRDAGMAERAPSGGRGGPRMSRLVEDDPTEDDPVEDDPTEDDPAEDDPTEDDPVEDDRTEDDPAEGDPTEDDPAEEDPTEDDPNEGDPMGDEPSEANPTDANRVGAEGRVRYAVRHWPWGCGRSPRGNWAEDAQSRCD